MCRRQRLLANNVADNEYPPHYKVEGCSKSSLNILFIIIIIINLGGFYGYPD